jgi:CarD family transcriptional regulator, regulator of rRNA transcription
MAKRIKAKTRTAKRKPVKAKAKAPAKKKAVTKKEKMTAKKKPAAGPKLAPKLKLVPKAAAHPKPAPHPKAAPHPKPIANGRPLPNGKPVVKAVLKPAIDPRAKFPLKPVVRERAKEEIVFKAGDHVVYPTHGVGKVLGIEKQEISGHSLQVITVHFEKDRMTLRVPVGKAKNSGLRRLSSRKTMDTALATLKGRSRIKRTMWSRRAQEYEAKINSGDPISIAEVVRDLHRNADQPDQSYSERQIYQAALDRLVRELAAVEEIDEQAATQRLEQLLKAA